MEDYNWRNELTAIHRQNMVAIMMSSVKKHQSPSETCLTEIEKSFKVMEERAYTNCTSQNHYLNYIMEKYLLPLERFPNQFRCHTCYSPETFALYPGHGIQSESLAAEAANQAKAQGEYLSPSNQKDTLPGLQSSANSLSDQGTSSSPGLNKAQQPIVAENSILQNTSGGNFQNSKAQGEHLSPSIQKNTLPGLQSSFNLLSDQVTFCSSAPNQALQPIVVENSILQNNSGGNFQNSRAQGEHLSPSIQKETLPGLQSSVNLLSGQVTFCSSGPNQARQPIVVENPILQNISGGNFQNCTSNSLAPRVPSANYQTAAAQGSLSGSQAVPQQNLQQQSVSLQGQSYQQNLPSELLQKMWQQQGQNLYNFSRMENPQQPLLTSSFRVSEAQTVPPSWLPQTQQSSDFKRVQPRYLGRPPRSPNSLFQLGNKQKLMRHQPIGRQHKGVHGVQRLSMFALEHNSHQNLQPNLQGQQSYLCNTNQQFGQNNTTSVQFQNLQHLGVQCDMSAMQNSEWKNIQQTSLASVVSPQQQPKRMQPEHQLVFQCQSWSAKQRNLCSASLEGLRQRRPTPGKLNLPPEEPYLNRSGSASAFEAMKMKPQVDTMHSYIDSVGFKEPTTAEQSGTKRSRTEASNSLLEEIEAINGQLSFMEVAISDEDKAACSAEWGEGTIVHCLFFCFGAQLPLRLFVPANYPHCSPKLLDDLTQENSGFHGVCSKAMAMLSESLRKLQQPMALGDVAKTWEDSCCQALTLSFGSPSARQNISTYNPKN